MGFPQDDIPKMTLLSQQVLSMAFQAVMVCEHNSTVPKGPGNEGQPQALHGKGFLYKAKQPD